MDENTRCLSQFLETFKEIAWLDESMWKWRHTKALHVVTNTGKLGHISLRTAISYPTSPLSIGCPLIPMFNCLRFSFANFIHCLMISYPPPLSFALLTSSFVVDGSFFVLGLLCYCWLSFHSCEFSLHRVFTWLFGWLFAFVFLFSDCVYLCCHLLCTFDDLWFKPHPSTWYKNIK
jgi:hypothetical protein